MQSAKIKNWIKGALCPEAHTCEVTKNMYTILSCYDKQLWIYDKITSPSVCIQAVKAASQVIGNNVLKLTDDLPEQE